MPAFAGTNGRRVNLVVNPSLPKKKPADVISVRRRGFEFRCPSGLAGSERLTVE
jgi:hypothetical protein